MHLIIKTPDAELFDGSVEVVTIPTATGIISVYPGHESLITTCVAGELEIETTEGSVTQNFAIGDGVVRVHEDRIEVLAQEIVNPEDIDVDASVLAAERAQKYLDETEIEDQEQFAKLQAELQKELAKVSVGNKYRSDLDKVL